MLMAQVALGACAERGTARDPGRGQVSASRAEPSTAIDTLLAQSAHGVVAFNSAVDGGIVLMDPTTGRKAFLTKGASPEWSAGGGAIAFMRAGRIYVTAATGIPEREIPGEPFLFEAPYMVRPVLSPGADRLAYSRQGKIELVDLAGGRPAYLLPPGPADDRMPVWSRQGGHLAFVRDRDIYVVRADGSGLRNLTADGADNLDPEWSPTGDRIAFSSRRTGQERIWTIAVDGSDRRTVTRDGEAPDHQEFHPSWSPDGSEIVFERWGGADAREGADIYIASVTTGTTRPLAVSPGFDGLPSWGPTTPAAAGRRAPAAPRR
jgi:Tol biopolymer transport system component